MRTIRTTHPKIVILLAFFISLVGVVLIGETTSAQSRNISFPIIGGASYSDDYLSPRSNGLHHATDIIATKGQKIVSATDGVIYFVGYPQPTWGYAVFVRDNFGYEYKYLHMNNDRPGTDDGNGGGMNAYAPDVERGNRVVRGQLLGYVGDSGNAETTVSHLHFEMYTPEGDVMNPYPSLRHAQEDGRKFNQPAKYPQLANELLPYGIDSTVGLNIALGHFGTVGEVELVTAPNTGGGPHIRTFNNDKERLSSFFAYDDKFRGGVDVASGDINGDGIDEIIVAPTKNGGPHVKVFKRDGTLLNEFFAYDKTSRYGVRLAAGDINGDGTDEIITVPNTGGGPHVKAFTRNGTLVNEFFAYDKVFKNGIDVSSGDVTGDGTDEIVTIPNKGGGPHLKVFSRDGTVLNEFFAYDKASRHGTRLTIGNPVWNTTQEEIITVPASSGGPHLKVFNRTGQTLQANIFLEEWWRGGYDVAAKDREVMISSDGGRRSTVRDGL